MTEGTGREIITLQIGNYSNYIGAHWFNLQQQYLRNDSEINPSILWREGLSPQRKPTWTPRVLIFDLHNSNNQFAALSLDTSGRESDWKVTLEESGNEMLWDGTVEKVSRDEDNGTSEVSEGGQVNQKTGENYNEKKRTPGTQEKSVNVKEMKPKGEPQSWGDYVQWKLHSMNKVAFSIPNFSHNSTSDVLFNYDQGAQIYQAMEEDVKDGIRLYAEHSDYFEGYHVLADQNDGFGGLAGAILEHISDEYKKKSCLTMGVSPATTAAWAKESAVDFKLRIFNTALAWNAFNHHSSVFTSIGLCDDICKPRPKARNFPLLKYNGQSAYESSAIIAAALDTLTSPYRLRSSTLMLNELINLLNGYGHKMTMFGTALPLSLIGKYGKERTLFETLSENGLDMLLSLTPGISLIDPTKSIGNFFIVRGVSNELCGRNKSVSQTSQMRNISNAQSCVEIYSQETYSKSVNVVRSVATPFKLSHPFPTLLVDQTYLQTQPKTRFQAQDSWHLPTMGSAHNSILVGKVLEKMIDEAQIEKMRRNFNWGQTNVEVDDYVECINDLRTLKDSFSDNR